MTQPRTISRTTKSTELDSDYKWGFVTDIESDIPPKGLKEDVVRLISEKKNEPEWRIKCRLRLPQNWLGLNNEYPRGATVALPPFDCSRIHDNPAHGARPGLY